MRSFNSGNYLGCSRLQFSLVAITGHSGFFSVVLKKIEECCQVSSFKLSKKISTLKPRVGSGFSRSYLRFVTWNGKKLNKLEGKIPKVFEDFYE